MITFKDLGLSENIISSILDAGYSTPTPVQAQAIPIACSGRDLIGCAQTGTGKTAAFVLPMLSHLQSGPRPQHGRPVRALIVTPTRELAHQVEEAIRVYGKHSRFRSLAIYGGVSMYPQLNSLRRNVDIVVATPGRLLDHFRRGTIDLSKIEILVLDEADRMLDMGFLPDIRTVVDAIPRERQTMLFSATMPRPIRALANSIMQQPEMIEVGERRNPAETVSQQVCMVPQEQKMDLLVHLLQTESTNNVLIFSRTKHRADKISRKLGQEGFKVTVMHSNRSQAQRQRSLDGFKRGHFQIMVATDIAARGIDVDSISHVINFDTPNQAEDYIHRIGRTGRAEAIGDAITFVAADERGSLRRIESHTGKRIDHKVLDGFQLEFEAPPARERRSGRSDGRRNDGRGNQGRPYRGNSRRRSSGGRS